MSARCNDRTPGLMAACVDREPSIMTGPTIRPTQVIFARSVFGRAN
jgi:hypothetical protein